DDTAAVDRQPAVAQDGRELLRRASGLDHDEALQLRVAVLLDDEQPLVLREEILDRTPEREAADTAVGQVEPALGQPIDRLFHRGPRAAERDDAPAAARARR